MTVYVFDGTMDGLLSAVFDAFRFLTFQNVDAVIVAALDG